MRTAITVPDLQWEPELAGHYICTEFVLRTVSKGDVNEQRTNRPEEL
jgi:hypothetical protein